MVMWKWAMLKSCWPSIIVLCIQSIIVKWLNFLCLLICHWLFVMPCNLIFWHCRSAVCQYGRGASVAIQHGSTADCPQEGSYAIPAPAWLTRRPLRHAACCRTQQLLQSASIVHTQQATSNRRSTIWQASAVLQIYQPEEQVSGGGDPNSAPGAQETAGQVPLQKYRLIAIAAASAPAQVLPRRRSADGGQGKRQRQEEVSKSTQTIK